MSEEIFRNKIIISSPESISIGYNTWFGLDTKLVGRIKALLKENEDLQQKVEQLEKELKETNNLLHKANDEVVSYCNRCIELENIRKEVIEQLQTTYNKDYYYKYDNKYLKSEIKNDLLNILNKGSEE